MHHMFTAGRIHSEGSRRDRPVLIALPACEHENILIAWVVVARDDRILAKTNERRGWTAHPITVKPVNIDPLEERLPRKLVLVPRDLQKAMKYSALIGRWQFCRELRWGFQEA